MNVGYKPCKDRKRLLDEIGKASFYVTELNLYLDTHPYDQQAIEAFNQYNALRAQLIKEFSENYGPINLDFSDSDTREWKWALQDWPWEGGFY